MHKTITIIGGRGLMGSLFAKLWQNQGYNISLIGRNDWQHAAEILAASDAVIISVPINLTNTIIQKITPHLSTNCILADLTSVKQEPLLNMLRYYNGPVVGLHPMFGPTIKNTQGNIVFVCPGRNEDKHQWLIKSLSKMGFTLKEINATKHDQAMDFTQGLEHFLSFALGSFLQHKNQQPQELLELASPIYAAKLLLLGRIFDQDPLLYADIILASQRRIQLIQEFAAWLNKLSANLNELNARDDFIALFKNSSSWMGEFTNHAQTISDKLLNFDFQQK